MKEKEIQIESLDYENYRQLQGKEKLLVSIVAVLFSIFGLWTNSFGLLTSIRQCGLFVSFLLFLIFLLYPFNAKSSMSKVPLADWLLAILGAAGGLYSFFTIETFAQKIIPDPSNLDIIFGFITILLILEATRRATGKWVAIISIFCLFYAYFGRYFPGVFAHQGVGFQRIIMRMYLTDTGIYGEVTVVATTYIFLFIIFGAFLSASGVSDFFVNFANALAGGSKGGPAKVAVIASAITGTVSGSAVANVVITGTFTIPLMKRCGYKTDFAAAVEAAASSGGLIMPPVMGSAAFIMSQFLGVSYLSICIAAIIPAFFYYVSVYCSVHYEAWRSSLMGLPKKDLPNLKEVLIKKGYLILPLFILIYSLIIMGRSAIFSAFLAIISVLIICQFNKKTRMGLKLIISALNVAGRGILSTGIACVACGIIIGIFTLTGLGQVIAYNILALSFNNLLLALFYMMIAALILGMGMPCTATYIVVASVCAPAIIRMGVTPLVAHFFVFYFAVLSNVTPPVALAAYAAAGLAHSSTPANVGWTALHMLFPAFIVPFLFVYSPMLLFQNIKYPDFLIILISTFLAIWSFAIADRGYYGKILNRSQRIIFLFMAVLLINTNILLSYIGIFGFIIALVYINKGKNVIKEAI